VKNVSGHLPKSLAVVHYGCLGSGRHRRFEVKARKTTPAGAVLAGVVLVLWLALVPAALAGQSKTGGGGGSNSLSGPVMVVDNNGNGAPNWDDTITFNVTSSATYPSVEVDCSQNGAMVYSGTVGFYPSYAWARQFILSSTMWTGGAASCTATLYSTNSKGRTTTLSSLSFSAGA
jgi:hypothetical protein